MPTRGGPCTAHGVIQTLPCRHGLGTRWHVLGRMDHTNCDAYEGWTMHRS